MSRRPQAAGHRSQVTGHKSQVTGYHVSKIILLSTCYLLLATLTGCEAFVRKFTRKPKGEIRKEEPIIQPEAYPDISSANDELYKDYFLFWESWVDELSSFLNDKANFKKQKECASESLDNLIKMQSLLNDEKAKSLEPLIVEFTTVKKIIFSGRLNSTDFYYLSAKAERIKTKVRRNFAFSKIKKDLK